MKQVCLIVPPTLDRFSELLILKFDKNLIERVLEFYRFSLYVRGMCGKVELVRQTDQLCPLLIETFHCTSHSPVVRCVTVNQIVDDRKVDGCMLETFLIRSNKTSFSSVVNIKNTSASQIQR
jgi:hypothetical protein